MKIDCYRDSILRWKTVRFISKVMIRNKMVSRSCLIWRVNIEVLFGGNVHLHDLDLMGGRLRERES